MYNGTGGGWRPHAGHALLCIFAFATIFVTTGDDAVWLVPYFSRRYSASARLLHGVAFVLALQVCVWTSYLLVVIFGNALDASATNARLSRALGFEVTSTALMAVVAAAVAWLIAAVLLIKACLKARRKSSTIVKVEEARLESYGAVAIGSKDGAEVVERGRAGEVAQAAAHLRGALELRRAKLRKAEAQGARPAAPPGARAGGRGAGGARAAERAGARAARGAGGGDASHRRVADALEACLERMAGLVRGPPGGAPPAGLAGVTASLRAASLRQPQGAGGARAGAGGDEGGGEGWTTVKR